MSTMDREPRVDAFGCPIGGFNFDLTRRNQMASKTAGLKIPKTKKTGTTIAGVQFDGGIVLGADTRATEGSTVCDKNCEKIHYIAPNIYCCGAGTAADTENVTEMVSGQLEILRYATDTKESRVVTAMTKLKRHLFRYQGHVSAALVLGGVDVTGPHLFTVWPHGSTDKLPFVTMGSGSLAAMAVFEAGYKDGLTEEEAKELVRRAICAGIFNDLGSGSNVDLCVLRKTKGKQTEVEMLRNVQKPNEVADLRKKVQRPPQMRIRKGATKWHRKLEVRKIHVVEEVVTKISEGDAMDTDA